MCYRNCSWTPPTAPLSAARREDEGETRCTREMGPAGPGRSGPGVTARTTRIAGEAPACQACRVTRPWESAKPSLTDSFPGNNTGNKKRSFCFPFGIRLARAKACARLISPATRQARWPLSTLPCQADVAEDEHTQGAVTTSTRWPELPAHPACTRASLQRAEGKGPGAQKRSEYPGGGACSELQSPPVCCLPVSCS